MPFLLAEVLNFQCTTHLIGVGSLSNVKHKYELVSTQNMEELKLSTPGKYMITTEKISESSKAVRYILLIGGCLILVGSAVYVVMKRRYWFW